MTDSIEALSLQMEQLAQRIVRQYPAGTPLDPSSPLIRELQATNQQLQGALETALADQEKQFNQEMAGLRQQAADQLAKQQAPLAPRPAPLGALAFEKKHGPLVDTMLPLVASLIAAATGEKELRGTTALSALRFADEYAPPAQELDAILPQMLDLPRQHLKR